MLALFTRESIECGLMKLLQPLVRWTNGIDEHEAIHSILILRCREHRDAAAPGVAEYVPSLDVHRFANCFRVACIVIDARGPCARWSLRFASAALVEENELAIYRKRSERGPENIMAEVKSAVDAEKRQLPIDTGTREHGELESARSNCLMFEWRGFLLFSSEREKPLACGAVMNGGVSVTWGIFFYRARKANGRN